MGTPVLILGASGSGKSTSLRNFEPTEVGVFNVASKPLPFKKRLNVVNHATYQVIQKTLAKNNLRCYVIDDSQYLMAFNMFDRAKEVGYQKFTDCALNFYNLLALIRDFTSEDTIVYLLHHIDRDDSGHIKAKTSGKMLDNQLTLEGLFSIVLLAETDGKTHWFTTQSDGFTPAKSPMEMFPARIDNDLKAVDTAIREYYGFIEGKEENEKH
jgi:hypothetical protein